LRFSENRISSRYGNVPLAEDLIDSVKNGVLKIINKQNKTNKDTDEVAEKIAIASLKYSILKSNAGKNMVFDFKKSISFDGDTGAYLLYTFVRTNSILNKIRIIKKKNLKNRAGEVPVVEKIVLKFPLAIKKSVKSNSPHYLANYLYHLSSEFNSFYAKTRILDKDNDNFLNNLILTKAVNITLKKGLYLLGINHVENM